MMINYEGIEEPDLRSAVALYEEGCELDDPFLCEDAEGMIRRAVEANSPLSDETVTFLKELLTR